MMRELDDEERKLLEKLADTVVKWHMTVPAIFFLEMHKPVSYIGSQFMIVMSPIMHMLFPAEQYDRVQKLMEDRQNIETLLCLIEEKERRKSKDDRK